MYQYYTWNNFILSIFQPWCATAVDEDREEAGGSDYCGPDCPIEANAWKADDTLKVTTGVDQKEMMIALKLHGILAFSFLLIGLMVTGLGMSVPEMFEKILKFFFSNDDLQYIEEPSG